MIWPLVAYFAFVVLLVAVAASIMTFILWRAVLIDAPDGPPSTAGRSSVASCFHFDRGRLEGGSLRSFVDGFS